MGTGRGLHELLCAAQVWAIAVLAILISIGVHGVSSTKALEVVDRLRRQEARRARRAAALAARQFDIGGAGHTLRRADASGRPTPADEGAL